MKIILIIIGYVLISAAVSAICINKRITASNEDVKTWKRTGEVLFIAGPIAVGIFWPVGIFIVLFALVFKRLVKDD